MTIRPEPSPEDYRPYNTFPEFAVGYAAYAKGDYVGPYDPDSTAAQAFDRGRELAARLSRWVGE
jgi:hypothetical protein